MTNAAGMSEPGFAYTADPPIVPKLRICAPPVIPLLTIPSNFTFSIRLVDSRIWLYVTIAPSTKSSPSFFASPVSFEVPASRLLRL